MAGFSEQASPSADAVPAEEIRAQLERLMESRGLANAPSLKRLLEFLVTQLLEGNADEVKEYLVGMEVFDRGESFDPRTDTIVRVQARRLRSKIEEYYATEGRNDSVLIELPKGGYVPVVRQAAPVAEEDGGPQTAPAAARAQILTDSHSLPAPRTPIVGRDADLLAVKTRVLSGTVRMLTLTGPGGTGKTRLAIEAARELSPRFPGGVHFVDLAGLSRPQEIAPVIARTLGIPAADAGSPEGALVEQLRHAPAAAVLLVLDNFEHLLAASPLVNEMLDACQALKVLVTSRTVLRLYGEHEYVVAPLPLPLPNSNSAATLSRNPGVELFVQRSIAANPSFKLTDENATDVRWICTRLDGLPLAIELAAARMKLFSPAVLRSRLDSRLGLLTGGPRDLPSRQQTLRGAIDWSYEILSPAEQRLFQRLSVFSGGFYLDAAAAVAQPDPEEAAGAPPLDILNGVASLVDKSVIQQSGPDNAEPRFTMLETIREYGLDRLREAGGVDNARGAHARFFLELAELGRVDLGGIPTAPWLRRCDAERGNYRSALDWLLETQQLEAASRLALALYPFWEEREHFTEGRTWLESVLEAGAASLSPATGARLSAVTAALIAHHHRAARFVLRQSMEAAGELGTRPDIALALEAAANAVDGNAPVQARAMLESALEVLEREGELAAAGWVLNRLADLAFEQEELDRAAQLYRQSAAAHRRAKHPVGAADALLGLARLGCHAGEYDLTGECLREAMPIYSGRRDWTKVGVTLEAFACLAAARHDPQPAIMLAGAAASVRDREDTFPSPVDLDRYEHALDPAWHELDLEDSRMLWEHGRQMGLANAIALALK